MGETNLLIEERIESLKIRARWMREMGFAEDEVSEACADNGSPLILSDEQDNLRAARELKTITPPISVLRSMAVSR